MSHDTKLTLEGSKLRLAISPRYTGLVRTIPGWQADRKNPGTWLAPKSFGVYLATVNTLEGEVDISPSVQAWVITRESANSIRLGVKENGLAHTEDDWWAEGLRPYQKTGAYLMALCGHFINTDQVGTGKTVQTLAAVKAIESFAKDPWPVLIVATNSMKYKWAEEATKWIPNCNPVVLDGSTAKKTKQLEELEGRRNLVICNWESLRTISRLSGYGSIALSDKERTDGPLNHYAARTVVVDEAHRLKDPKSKQTRAAWRLLHQAEYRWALTGTPIGNSPIDLWSILHGISPDEWPSRSRYIDRYVEVTTNFWGGMEVQGWNQGTMDEFQTLYSPISIRRTTAEVLPELPERLPPEVRWLDMPTAQEKVYRTFEKDMIVQLDSGTLITTDVLTKVGILRTMAMATPVLNEEGRIVGVGAPSCKVAALIDIVDEMGGEPLVVFAESRRMINFAHAALTKLGVKCSLITGEVSPEGRAGHVERFQDGRTQVLLATIGAGSEGITLTAADTAVFLQRSFSAISNTQAEGRINRFGQTRPTRIIHLITNNTIEESVYKLTTEKTEHLQELVKDPDFVKVLLKNEK